MKTLRILALSVASVLLTPLAAWAVTDTWDGGGANENLSTSANWLDNSAPASDLPNTDLIFAGVIRLTPNVSAAFSTHSISFNNTAGAFTIGGLQLNVGTGGITNRDSQTMTFNNLVNFSGVANSTINASFGGLTFANTVAFPTGTLTVTGGFPTSFTNISGTGALTKSGAGMLILSGTNAYFGTTTVSAGTLLVNGSQPQSPVSVSSGATLGGSGRLGNISSSGIVAPGGNPGILTSSNVTFNASATFAVELNGTVVGNAYDQLNVLGTVELGRSTLSVTVGFIPVIGNTFTIIDNDGGDAVSGAFAGLAQGALLTNGPSIFQISYTGGTGNDVVLTRVNPPSQIQPILIATNREAQLEGLGLAGLTYALHASTNLMNWTVIGTALANGSGVYTFVDTNAPLFSLRFYRVRSP